MPPTAASQPAWRPMASTTMTRWCETVVERSRSIESATVVTAESNPMQASVSGTSLSIVFGTPTTGWASPASRPATDRVSSPPIATSASRFRSPNTAVVRAYSSGSRVGFVRDEPSSVPPTASAPSVAGADSGSVSRFSTPAQPSLNPRTLQPSDSALRTTARIAALSPGQSPPPVRTPIFTFAWYPCRIRLDVCRKHNLNAAPDRAPRAFACARTARPLASSGWLPLGT